ncbi:hypothetical protein GmHk_06G017186 [Glycine max]|nr:hypothetical protein GmHk_06G017186 [Glycine max]
MHPFVYSCGLVGYAYGSSFLYTILENRLWWRDSVCGSGYEMINEDQQNWKEMTNTMMKINKKAEEMFSIVHVMDRPYGEVTRSFIIRLKDEPELTWHLLHSSGNMHSVTYNQDLVSPTLLAGWIELRVFYKLTRNYQVTLTHYGQSVFLLTIFKILLIEYKVTCSSLDLPSTMYSFMKATRFTHLNLEETTKCRIDYNYYRKSAKIGNR